jgi:predicted transcriptional regulator
MENKALLISVHPEYMRLYKLGSKIAELRKNEPKQQISEVYLYNTGTGKIELKAGLIEIKKTILSELQKRYFKYIGIQPESIKPFCNKKGEGFLLIFSYISKLTKEISYQEMTTAGIMPPQSYVYFNPEIFRETV